MSLLNPELEAKYRQILTNAARDLTRGESLPINIEHICARLEVEHERNLLDYSRAHLTGKSKINLPTSPESEYFSAKDRYLIAHEIGHIVLVELCSATPLGKSQYWQFEDLCNGFARQLLIPQEAIPNLPKSISSPREALSFSSDLAREAFVPWPTAAWRLTELFSEFALLDIFVRRQRGTLVMKINASTLPRKQLQQKTLDIQKGLGKMLIPLTRGDESISLYTNEAERLEITKELPGLGSVKEAYGIRDKGGIHVAFQLHP